MSTVAEPSTGHEIRSEVLGPGIRIAVGLLDGIFISIGGMLVGLFAGAALLGILIGSSGAAVGSEEAAVGAAVGGFVGSILGTIVGPFFMALLFMIIEGCVGFSPAGLLLKVKVCKADGTAGNFKVYVLRALIKFSPTLLMLFSIFLAIPEIGYLSFLASIVLFFGLFTALGDSKQTLYDKLSGTAVGRKV
ncbi:MAG: hypothetical protein HOB73_14065 [Planctomycetaceae bacterium]|jgi:hypothetical protein|nr:hypothetical protein [Planctomycetaceae bacterium]